MKRLLVILAVVSVVLVLASVANAQSGAAQASIAGTWQYAQVGFFTATHKAVAVLSDRDMAKRVNDAFDSVYTEQGEAALAVDYLDKMGLLSWELVSVANSSDGMLFTFKRPG